MAQDAQHIPRGLTPSPLRWSMTAGFLAWGLDLGSSYVLQRHSCTMQSTAILHSISVVCLLIALSGFFVGLNSYRRFGDAAHDLGRRPADRAYFQALLGMGFSLGFAVVILAGAFPRWILNPCN